jgi:excinuclease ABC subunit A
LYRKSIADVLEMPCGDAVELFADDPKISRILQTLCDVGLDYVTLGQSAPTLSGGEAQRVKLAAELARPSTDNTLYLFDEPTTGLHFEDIAKLLSVLQRLVDLGNTVVVIEHNMDVIKCADWIIDMGPGAGVDGGEVVFNGTPEQLAATAVTKNGRPKKNTTAVSVTAPFVAETLASSGSPQTAKATAQSKQASSKAGSAPRRKPPAPKMQRQGSPSRDLQVVLDVPQSATSAQSSPARGEASEVSTIASGVAPWRALGRRWHSISKGFTADAKPEWPLELADRVLAFLEQVAGDDSLSFETPDKVDVRPGGTEPTWAEVKTKTPESLKVTLAGPPEAVDLDQLSSLDVRGSIDNSDAASVRVTLNLTEVKHVRSRKLRSFLKTHYERSVRA